LQGSGGTDNIIAFQMGFYVPSGSTDDLRFFQYTNSYAFGTEFQIQGNHTDLQSPASGSGGTFTLDQWHTIEMDAWPLQNRVDLYVDGSLVQQGTFFNTGPSIGAFGFWNLGGTGSVYIDNLSVFTETPEPGCVVLVMTGLAALAGRRRRVVG
jgi:hypothetical protein